MNSVNERQQALIERYLSGQLSNEDKRLLEQYQKDNNQHFLEELRFQEAIKKVVKKQAPNKNLRALLKKEAQIIKAELPKDYLRTASNRERFRVIKKSFSIAASILLLISMSSVFWANQQFSSPVIAASLVEKPMKNTSMSTIPDITALSKGKEAFFKEQYEEAKQLLLRITPTTTTIYTEAQIFLAYIYFEQKNYVAAISQFNQLLGKDFEMLPATYKNKNKLRWNRLLAYVGKEETNTTFFKKELAYFLNNKSTFYQQKARQLQAMLNSPWRKIVFV